MDLRGENARVWTWGGRRASTGFCPQPDSAVVVSGGGTGPGMKGKHLSWRVWGRKGKMRGRPGGRGQDTIDTTRKGRLLCVCVCARLDFCWEITCIRECHGHSHEGGGQTEHGHRLGETNSLVTSECSVICRLDPGGEKGRSWKSWGDPSKARSLAESVCSVTF